jgi:hypothetical protein
MQSDAQRLTTIPSVTEPALTSGKLAQWENDFEDVSVSAVRIESLACRVLISRRIPQTPTLKLSQLLLTNSDPVKLLVTRASQIADQHIFNIELKGIRSPSDSKDKKGSYPGPVTNQKASGRCWLFATSTLEVSI